MNQELIVKGYNFWDLFYLHDTAQDGEQSVYQPPHWLEILGARIHVLIPEPQERAVFRNILGPEITTFPFSGHQSHSSAEDSIWGPHSLWVADLAMENRAEQEASRPGKERKER